MKNRFVGAAAALGLGIGLVITAVVAASDIGGEDDPEPLPVLTTASAGGEEAASDDAARMTTAASLDYEFRGEIPDLPDEAAAWHVVTPEGPEASIADLAGRLGIDGDVQREDNEGFALWRVTGGSWVLEVYDQPGLPWNAYNTAAQDAVVRCAAPDCPPDTACTQVCEEDEPQRPAGLPSAEEAEAQARDLLGETVEGATAQVHDGITAWFVSFDPVIGGLPTVGMSSGVAVGADGIQNTSGWLGDVEEGDDYPLADPAEALHRLNEEQQSLAIATPAPCEPGPATDCGPVDGGEPVVVTLTDVRLGLLLMNEYLVPAYLFAVEDGGPGSEIPVIAVEAEHLVEPPPVGIDPDTPVQVDPAAPGEPGEDGEPGQSTPGSSGSSSGSGSAGQPGQPGSTGTSSSCSSSTANSLTVELCIEGPVPVGQPVQLTVRSSDPSAPVRQDCGSPVISWGDEDGTAVCEIGCVPGGGDAGEGEASQTYEHAYSEPGEYLIEVTAESNCGESPGARVSTSVSVTVE